MPRFAIHKQQILSEEEQNNNTNYHLRLEIEEASILKSWKILQSIPSESGNKSRAIIYQQDLPLMYLYVEKSPEEANSDTGNHEADIISLWDMGTYKSLSITSSITEQIRSGKVELLFAGTKIYGRFSLLRESLSTSPGKSSQRNDENDIWYFVKEQENEQENDIRRVGLTATQLPSQMKRAIVSRRQPTAAITPPKQQKV